MQGDLFDADQVLTTGQVLRYGERVSWLILSRPRDGLAAVSDCRNLVNLEPDVPRAVPARDVGTARRLGHVDVDDARVVDRAVGHDAHLGAGGDGDRLRGGVRRRVVAAEVGRGDVGDGRLGVEVVRLADVDPRRRRRAVHDERGEGVCGGAR